MISKSSIAIASGALLIGAGAGYFVANKNAQKKWQKISEEEILAVKKHYNMVFDEEQYDDPKEAAEADRERTHQYLARLDQLGYSEDPEEQDVQEVPEEAAPEEVAEVEAPQPVFDEDYPFPISKNEFFHDKDEYEKLTLTYYHGDDIVADVNDSPLNDVEKLIGKCHKKFMGFDKEEPFVVYVRNHKMAADYEVLFDEQAFITFVHGIPTEPMR